MRRPDELFIPASEPQAARALDTTESIFWVYEKHGSFRAAHTLVVDGPLTPGLLVAAMRRLQARHPALRRELIATEQGPQFVPSNREPALAWVRSKLPFEKWAREAERELNGPSFPEGTLPWRLGFIEGPTTQGPHGLILTVHHSLTDGLGTARIIDDLLAYCAELLEGVPFGEGLAALPAPPTLDEALSPEPSARDLLRHRARNVVRRFKRQKAKLLPFEGMAAPNERRTGALMRDVSPELFKALHEAARANRCSLNGVLTVLTVDTLAALYGNLGELGVSTQASLRGKCQPAVGPNNVGCYVSNVVVRAALGDRRSLWVRAQEISAQVQRALDAREPQIALRAGRGRLAAFDRATQLAAADRESQGRLGALSVSNRGPVPAKRHGPFQLQALYSPAGVHVLGPSLQVSFGTVNDRLCCTLSFPRPLVSERMAKAVMHELTTRIAAAAGAKSGEDARRTP